MTGTYRIEKFVVAIMFPIKFMVSRSIYFCRRVLLIHNDFFIIYSILYAETSIRTQTDLMSALNSTHSIKH